MRNLLINRLAIGLLVLLNGATITSAESSFCSGKNAFINIVNRPSNSDSPCVIPYKHFDLELGAAYQKLAQGMGEGYNFPQPEVRIGLLHQSELFFFLPNYYYQRLPVLSGFTNASLGLKHQLGYTDKWVWALEGELELPGGSKNFGTKALGGIVNGIISCTLSNTLSLTFVIGVSTESDSINAGGRRYNSFNPDGLLAYSFTDTLSFYAEVYGQTKTSATTGSGFNADAGLLYLIRPNMVVDLSAGQRLSGFLGGFNHYFEAGMSFLI
ncbi:transporter [Legionella sp. D16C41]|uniref:transporter n=1 Tax=Legionella sp. D16C41 TaxID=3402688 RepID=UPI003AF9705B